MAVTGSRGSRSNRGTESTAHREASSRTCVICVERRRDRRAVTNLSQIRPPSYNLHACASAARAACNLDQWVVSHTKIGRRTDGNVLAAPRRAWQHDRFMRSTSMRSKNDTTVSRRGTARCNDLASPTAPPLEVAAWVIAAAPCSAPRLPARSRRAEHSHGH
jgi:hypothetical protein